jgi:hypothetical protein
MHVRCKAAHQPLFQVHGRGQAHKKQAAQVNMNMNINYELELHYAVVAVTGGAAVCM